MRYPEGQTVKVGDLIWWNEGICIGFVEEVMESRKDYENWGLDEPSVAFTNLHPFEANLVKHQQHIGGPTTSGTVVDTEAQLENEGIGLLTDHECEELEWAISHAQSLVSEDIRDRPFCVSALMDMDRMEEDWNFDFVDGECGVIESVVFPFRPNTRSEEEQGGETDS